MKLIKGLGLVFLVSILLTACSDSSDVGQKLSDYHNDLMSKSGEKMSEINQIAQEASQATSVEEMYDIQKEDLPRLADELKDYVESQDPESDVVKEYHELRVQQINKWHEAVMMDYEALERLANGEISEEEANEKSNQAQEKLAEFQQLTQEADAKLKELAEEYEVELEETQS